MGTTWDKMTVGLTDKTGDALTLADANTSDGKFGDYPPGSIASNASGSFSAQSKDDALVGPEGYVQYGMPDGTTMTIRFSLPYGTSDHYCRITFEGPRSSKYSTTNTKDDYRRSNGGAGKRWDLAYDINKT